VESVWQENWKRGNPTLFFFFPIRGLPYFILQPFSGESSPNEYAILGDIMKFEALTAVWLTRRAGCNPLRMVGDIVGYNANPVESLDMVRSLNAWPGVAIMTTTAT
jgi:hypothetical protein